MIVDILFYITALVAIISGILVITGKSPVTSALSLVLNFFCIAFIYLMLEAQFLAIIQVIVYAGAIMVLFLFVIMLLNLQDDQTLFEKFDLKKGFAVLLTALFLLEILYILPAGTNSSAGVSFPELGTVEAIGKYLFSEYLYPFEMISVVLLAAVVGAVVVAKKKVD
ncbi:MAG: NADH-quinone oxidoreductase subunit J [Bacteroidetes bacterium]|nr:NADH-quinone oxidoreductase subunit J [Bacteroidota bacterium]